MPCYGCQLKPFPSNRSIFLGSTIHADCHGKRIWRVRALTLILLAFAPSASPQISRTAASPDDQATVEGPDFDVRVPRPNAPRLGEEDLDADTQTSENGVRHLRGKVRIELHNA